MQSQNAIQILYEAILKVLLHKNTFVYRVSDRDILSEEISVYNGEPITIKAKNIHVLQAEILKPYERFSYGLGDYAYNYTGYISVSGKIYKVMVKAFLYTGVTINFLDIEEVKHGIEELDIKCPFNTCEYNQIYHPEWYTDMCALHTIQNLTSMRDNISNIPWSQKEEDRFLDNLELFYLKQREELYG